MYERSILGSVLGLPGYAAIAIALGFTGLGVFIDLNRINGLGSIFKGCYFAGCVLAVCWVKRRALFGPMVQPPLLLAIAVPGVVLLSGTASSTGTPGFADRLLSIGAPLLNGFPTMAVATAFALAIGIGRYVMQRPSAIGPPRPPRSPRPPLDGEPGRRPRPPQDGPPYDRARPGAVGMTPPAGPRARPERFESDRRPDGARPRREDPASGEGPAEPSPLAEWGTPAAPDEERARPPKPGNPGQPGAEQPKQPGQPDQRPAKPAGRTNPADRPATPDQRRGPGQRPSDANGRPASSERGDNGEPTGTQRANPTQGRAPRGS